MRTRGKRLRQKNETRRKRMHGGQRMIPYMIWYNEVGTTQPGVDTFLGTASSAEHLYEILCKDLRNLNIIINYEDEHGDDGSDDGSDDGNFDVARFLEEHSETDDDGTEIIVYDPNREYYGLNWAAFMLNPATEKWEKVQVPKFEDVAKYPQQLSYGWANHREAMSFSL